MGLGQWLKNLFGGGSGLGGSGLMEPSAEARSWYEKGYQAITEGPEREIECHRRAVSLCPDYYDAWYHLEKAYGAIGNGAEAQRCREQLERITTTRYQQEAQAAMGAGRRATQGAEWYFDKLVPTAPGKVAVVQAQRTVTSYSTLALELWLYPEEKRVTWDGPDIRCLASDPGGECVVITSEYCQRGIEGGERVWEAQGMEVDSAIVSPASDRVALLLRKPGGYKTEEVVLLSLEDPTANVKTADPDSIRAGAWAPDGSRIVLGRDSVPNEVLLVDTSSGETISRLTTDFKPASLAVSLDGTAVVAGGGTIGTYPHGLAVFDIDNSGLTKRWNMEPDARQGPVLFNANGSALISFAEDAGVKVWDAKRGSEVRSLDTPKENMRYMFHDPGGAAVILGDSHSFWHVPAAAAFKK